MTDPVFTVEQVVALTGLSKWRLSHWSAIDFFKPEVSERDGRHVALYSFRDVVGLRVLAILRDEHRVSLGALQQVGEWLQDRYEQPWSTLRFFVAGREVFFRDPSTDTTISATSIGQTAIPIELEPIAERMRASVSKMRARTKETRGKIEQQRGVVGHAPKIAGTRVPTAAIWSYFEAGRTPRAILREYPELSIADINAAIAYEKDRRAKRSA